MKWPLSLILSVAVLLSSCAATPPPSPNLRIIEQAKPSVVRLVHEEEDGSYAVCSGFLVDPTHFVSAAHCTVREWEVNGVPVRLVRQSDTLALYEIPALMGPPMEIRKAPLTVGEEVIGLGYGLGAFQVFTRHVAIPQLRGDVVVDGLMIRGMSGGPTIDLEGKVVGVIQRGAEDAETVLCGQDEIRAFLKQK